MRRLISLVLVLVLILFVFSGLVNAQSITVNASTQFQTIDGFGVASANRNALPAAQAQLLFDPVNGIGLDFLRVGIDPAGNVTGSGAPPSIGTWTDAKAAISYGAKVWGTPWTPPAVWKTNNSLTNGGWLQTQFYSNWANVLVQFVNNAAANGVPIYGVSMQNEPDVTASYVSCVYGNDNMGNFINVAGPIIRAAYPNLKIIAPESGYWSDLGGYVWNIGHLNALQYTDIYATHQYSNLPQGTALAPTDTQRKTWMTEFSTPNGDSSINDGIQNALTIDQGLTVGNATAWHWWWTYASDSSGLYVFNGSTYIPAKRLYTLGNFSKFVRPGYIRIGTSGSISGVTFESYENPVNNTPVIIAINSTASNQPLAVSLVGTSAVSMIPYVTSASLNLAAQSAVPVNGGSFNYTLPATSVTTFVGSGSTAPIFGATNCYATWSAPYTSSGVPNTNIININGQVTLPYTYNCNPGFSVAQVELAFGCADSLSISHACQSGWNNPFGATGFSWLAAQGNTGSITWDPTKPLTSGPNAGLVLPNQEYDVNVWLLDSTGMVIGAASSPSIIDLDMVMNLTNQPPSPTPQPTPTPQPGSTYLIGSSWVIDGGFYKALFNFPPAAEAYTNNQPNPSQQYQIVPSGTGFTICNLSDEKNGVPTCLTDGGSVVDQGQGTDVWTIKPSGSNWTLQNQRTGKYIGTIPQVAQANIPMSATLVAIPLTYISGNPIPTPTPTPTSTPQPTATPTPAPVAPNSCIVTENSPAVNAIMSGSAYPINLTISCNNSGIYDHARWSEGIKGGNGELGFAILPFGVSSVPFDTTKQANGAIQSAVAIYLDAAETQQVGVNSGPSFGWYAFQYESISNVVSTPTPTPQPTPSPTSTPTPTPQPTPTPVPTPSPTPSPVTPICPQGYILSCPNCVWAGVPSSCMIVTTIGPTITDSNNQLWSIVASSGGQVAINGIVDTTTSNVIELLYTNGIMYHKNIAGHWYSDTSLTAAHWIFYSSTSGPACASSTPTPVSTSTPSSTPTPVSSPTPTPQPTPTPVAGIVRANDLLNSMGVGTKLIQGDNEIGAVNGFKYLGVRLSRDDATTCQTGTYNNGMPICSLGFGGGFQQELCDVHAATGVTYTELPITFTDPNSIASTQNEWHFIDACGAMAYAEGPNEANNFNYTYLGNPCSLVGSSTACAAYQAALYSMVKGDSILSKYKVLGATDPGAEASNDGLQHLIVQAGDNAVGAPPVGTLLADIANTHAYIQGNFEPAVCQMLDNQNFWATSVNRGGPAAGAFDVWGEFWGGNGIDPPNGTGSGTWGHDYPINVLGQNDIPKIITETGFNRYRCNPATDPVVQGKLIANEWFQAIRMGWLGAIVYQMNDARVNDGGYGFFNNDGTSTIADATNALPDAIYTHNITTILADTSSAFTPVILPYTITGIVNNSDGSNNAYSLLVQRSDGAYFIIVWGEAYKTQAVYALIVNFSKSFANVNLFDPTIGSTPIQASTSGSSIAISVSDHPIIIKLQ